MKNSIFKKTACTVAAAGVLAMSPAAAFADNNDGSSPRKVEAVKVSINGDDFKRDITVPMFIDSVSDGVSLDKPASLVPGAELSANAVVKNDSDKSGSMKFYLIDPRTVDVQDLDPVWAEITVNGTSIRELLDNAVDIDGTHRGVLLDTVDMKPGDTYNYDGLIKFPFEAVGGNEAGAGAVNPTTGTANDYAEGVRKAAFDYMVVFEGVDPVIEEPPTVTIIPETPFTPPVRVDLPRTGAEVLPYALGGGVLLLAGGGMYVLAKRRGAKDEDAASGSSVEVIDADVNDTPGEGK